MTPNKSSMSWVCPVLLVLVPAILYCVALSAAAIVSAFYRRKCPACAQRGLKRVNFIRATVLVDGRRAPDSWSYYAFERCGAGFKLHRGVWSRVEADELRR